MISFWVKKGVNEITESLSFVVCNEHFHLVFKSIEKERVKTINESNEIDNHVGRHLSLTCECSIFGFSLSCNKPCKAFIFPLKLFPQRSSIA